MQNNIFALLLFGFGILVSLFPFHSWAPKGYATAPTGAAMLHAGVLKKFGLYGLLQLGCAVAASRCGTLVPLDRVVGAGQHHHHRADYHGPKGCEDDAWL